MHFKLTHKLPERCIVACSGGSDSLGALYWLHRTGKVEEIIYINHQTGEFADESQHHVATIATNLNIPCTFYRAEFIPPGHNPEEWWREERYRLFNNHPGDLPIVLGHTLDDCVEEYITCSIIRGYHGTIPYRHGRCIRPFRTVSKHDLQNYLVGNEVQWMIDPTNNHQKYLRGKYRMHLVPWLKENINHGLDSMVRRMIEEGLGDNNVSSRRQENSNRGANLAAALDVEDH